MLCNDMQSAPRYRIDSKFQRVWNSNLAWLRHWRESAGLPTGQGLSCTTSLLRRNPRNHDPLTPARSLPYSPRGFWVPRVVKPNVWANNTIQQDLPISEGE